VGAGINRLQAAVAVMATQSQNSQAAESTIRDANVAQEVSNLTKYQILAQSGIAALAQANMNSQNILSLFKAI
jgi:flagellin